MQDEGQGPLGGIDFDSISSDYDDGLPDAPPAPVEDLFPDETAGYDSASEEILSNVGKRPVGAAAYQRKVNNLLTAGVAATAGNPATVADAAAILIHGKKIAHSVGDLAAENKRVADIVDFLNGGTATPIVATVAALVPFALQIFRNHEPEISNVSRISLPFTKGKIGINIPSRFRLRFNSKTKDMLTNDPQMLVYQAFLSEAAQQKKVVEKLAGKGIGVAPYTPRHVKE